MDSMSQEIFTRFVIYKMANAHISFGLKKLIIKVLWSTRKHYEMYDDKHYEKYDDKHYEMYDD